MSKEKQIEEMVKTVSACECDCINCKICYSWELCEALYNAGYRKQSEGEWKDRGLVKSVNPANVPIVECSKCNITFCDILNNHHLIYRYCPFCGAKMKGGE